MLHCKMTGNLKVTLKPTLQGTLNGALQRTLKPALGTVPIWDDVQFPVLLHRGLIIKSFGDC